MTTVRVKDIWMRRTAVERVLRGKHLPQHGAALKPNGEIIWLAFVDYQIWRDRKWEELGGKRGVKSKDNPGGISEKEFERIKQRFNDAADEEAQTEVTLPNGATRLSKLTGMEIQPVDLWAMQELGVIEDA